MDEDEGVRGLEEWRPRRSLTLTLDSALTLELWFTSTLASSLPSRSPCPELVLRVYLPSTVDFGYLVRFIRLLS